MNPTGITVGMLNIDPCPLVFYTLKRHTLLDPENNGGIRTRAGTDIAITLFDDNCFDFIQQGIVDPALVPLKVLYFTPIIFSFQDDNRIILLYFPDNIVVCSRAAANIGDRGRNSKTFRARSNSRKTHEDQE